MAAEIIEGTLEPAQPISTRRGYARFDGVAITSASGERRVLPKFATGEPVTSEIIKGGAGRYYFAKVDGGHAIFGVRRADGTATYGHYDNLETMLLVVGLLGTAAAVARFGFGVEAPWLAAILGPLLLLGWGFFRNRRIAQKTLFDAG